MSNQTVAVHGLLALLVVVAGVGVGTAQTDAPAWSDDLYGDLQTMVPVYNENADSISIPVGDSLLRNARISVEVSDDAGAVAEYSIETDGDKRITSLARGPHEDPTLRVVTSRAAMAEIAASGDPAGTLTDKLASGEVELHGTTAGTAAVTAVIEVVRAVGDLLSGLGL